MPMSSRIVVEFMPPSIFWSMGRWWAITCSRIPSVRGTWSAREIWIACRVSVKRMRVPGRSTWRNQCFVISPSILKISECNSVIMQGTLIHLLLSSPSIAYDSLTDKNLSFDAWSPLGFTSGWYFLLSFIRSLNTEQ